MIKVQKLKQTPAILLAALSANKIAIGALALLLGSGAAALARGTDNRAPEVPEEIAIPEGNKVLFHGFGVGFQIYTWNGVDWGRAVPEATLFDGNGVVAIHFAGPTWQSKSGSSVRAEVVPPAKTVDTNSIPWLLLKKVVTEGSGILTHTTYVQRVNTVGGLAPREAGTFVGQVARVPYTADYFFFREEND